MANREYTIEEIEVLLEKITPGKWIVIKGAYLDDVENDKGYPICREIDCCSTDDNRCTTSKQNSINLEFIADSADIIRQLLKKIKESEK